MFDFHILISLLAILLTWKWGDWQNWQLYYPTILYMIIGDLTYLNLASNKPLWQYESRNYSGDFIEFLIAFIVFPCTCFIFFSLYAKARKYKSIVVYILFFIFCAFIYTSFEGFSFLLGFISYNNGWNLYWSFALNLTMFPLILLHYKKPLWVWLPSIACAFIVIYKFSLPFGNN